MHRHQLDPTEPFALRRRRPGARRAGHLRHPARRRPRRRTTTPRPPGAGRGAHRRRPPAAPGDPRRRGLALRLCRAHPRLVVTDVAKENTGQVAAALRALFLAAGGGGARPVHRHPPAARRACPHRRAARGKPACRSTPSMSTRWTTRRWSTSSAPRRRLPARHRRRARRRRRAGPLAAPAGLRPRALAAPDHPAPRTPRAPVGGGKGYDDAVARHRLRQAFGRLIRRADDKGVFVMLDRRALAPAARPAAGGGIRRLGLAQAVADTRDFLAEP